jgi:hypothetical protein
MFILRTLKIEVTCSSETSVDFQRTKWHYIPEDRTLNKHHVRTSDPILIIQLLLLGYLTGDSVSRGVHGRVVGSGTMLQAGRLRGRFPMRSLNFFHLSNPSNCTMDLGSTQPLTEMSPRNVPGGKGRPARMADNLTAICEPTV